MLRLDCRSLAAGEPSDKGTFTLSSLRESPKATEGSSCEVALHKLSAGQIVRHRRARPKFNDARVQRKE
jgi:hypothetical protein